MIHAATIDPARWRQAQSGFHAEPWQALPQAVRRSSRALPWRGLSVWQQGGPVEDLYVAPTGSHCIILRNGPATRLLQRQGEETALREWAPGEAVLVPAGTPSFWRSDAPRDNVHLDIQPQWLEQAHGSGSAVRLRPCFGAHDALLARLAKVLLAAIDDMTGLQPGFADAMAMAIALHLLEHYAEKDSAQERACALTARELRRVTDFVQAHLDGPCDVARLAREVALSPAHFARCFKATAGVTPHQYVTRLKMEHARELLLASGLQVADVAQAVGFASRAHFTQAFRRHWGATPAALRRHD